MDISDATGTPLCPVWWTRDAAQFSAEGDAECTADHDSPSALALSEQQFWWTPWWPRGGCSCTEPGNLPAMPTSPA